MDKTGSRSRSFKFEAEERKRGKANKLEAKEQKLTSFKLEEQKVLANFW